MALDKVAAAIEATEPAPLRYEMVTVSMATGRQVTLHVPSDMTEGEAIGLVNFITGGLGPELQRRRGRPQLAIARELPKS